MSQNTAGTSRTGTATPSTTRRAEPAGVRDVSAAARRTSRRDRCRRRPLRGEDRLARVVERVGHSEVAGAEATEAAAPFDVLVLDDEARRDGAADAQRDPDAQSAIHADARGAVLARPGERDDAARVIAGGRVVGEPRRGRSRSCWRGIVTVPAGRRHPCADSERLRTGDEEAEPAAVGRVAVRRVDGQVEGAVPVVRDDETVLDRGTRVDRVPVASVVGAERVRRGAHRLDATSSLLRRAPRARATAAARARPGWRWPLRASERDGMRATAVMGILWCGSAEAGGADASASAPPGCLEPVSRPVR